METLTFTSRSKHKMNLLVQVAKEMGITTKEEQELTDEDMALPRAKPTQKQIDLWLAKGDGDEEYTSQEILAFVKKNLAKAKK